jgi:hypothetical protein
MRLLTIVIVMGLSAFAVFDGWSIASFARARAQSAGGAASADTFRYWAGIPGLAGAVMQATLSPMRGAADIDSSRRRMDELAALLSVHPLSGSNWLALAGMRLVTAQSYEQVLAALAMSSLTAPNEGMIMAQRGIFGLLQWEALPANARQRAANDLAGIILATSMGKGEANVVKTIVQAKPAESRSQIAALLGATGVPTAELARIGIGL